MVEKKGLPTIKNLILSGSVQILGLFLSDAKFSVEQQCHGLYSHFEA